MFRKFFSMFRRPSPLQIASQMLQEAELHRLESSQKVDYYVAIERMYKEQIIRLRSEITEMAAESEGTSNGRK